MSCPETRKLMLYPASAMKRERRGCNLLDNSKKGGSFSQRLFSRKGEGGNYWQLKQPRHGVPAQ